MTVAQLKAIKPRADDFYSRRFYNWIKWLAERRFDRTRMGARPVPVELENHEYIGWLKGEHEKEITSLRQIIEAQSLMLKSRERAFKELDKAACEDRDKLEALQRKFNKLRK